MNHSKTDRRSIAGLLLLAAVLSAAPPASAADLLTRLAERGCEAVRSELESVALESSADPNSPGASSAPGGPALRRAAGICAVEWRDYAGALDLLVDAAASDGQAQLARAKAHYQLGDFDQAESALELADDSSREVAEWQLYRGMIDLARGRHGASARHLDRARRLGPDSVEPVASYHAGLAWIALRDHERASEALTRVANDWPGTLWAKRAEAALALLAGARALRPQASASVGVEYDDNVVVRGRDVSLPSEISREYDGRVVWSAAAGATLDPLPGWSTGLLASYQGSAHFQLADFDSHYLSGTAWVDGVVSRSLVGRLRYDVGHAWVDDASFLWAHDVEASLRRGGGDRGSTTVAVRARFDDFRFPLVSAEVDRDGAGAGASVEHVRPLPDGVAEVKARLAYEFFRADGSEYDFQAAAIELGIGADLPRDFRADLSAGYSYRPYRNHSTFSTGTSRTRRDHRADLELKLTRRLSDRMTIRAQWRYRRNASNLQVFDHSRHVAGVFVDLSLP